MNLKPYKLSGADLVRVGSAGLRGRPLRAFLSALGIGIGIAAMLAVVGISFPAGPTSTARSTGSAPTC